MNIKEIFDHISSVSQLFLNDINNLQKAEDIIVDAIIRQKKKIAFCGNGGSATLASHLVGEFVGRYKEEVRFPAISFNDIANLTCLSNDYGYDNVFSMQVEAYLKEGDVFVAFSTSGNSDNIIKALQKAKELNITTIFIGGKTGGKAKDVADVSIIVPSDDTPTIQVFHLIIGHYFCEKVDEESKK